MKNSIEQSEKIDAYLTGKMSDAEKNEFERLLSDPETSLEDRTKLQDEMELRKEIIFAVRKRGFREHVAKELTKIKEEEEAHNKKVRRIIGWTSGSITMFAAAAVVQFMIMLAPVRTLFYNYSCEYAQSFQEVSQTRSDEGDALSQQLLMAKIYIMEDNWKQADQVALSVMEVISQSSATAYEQIYVETRRLDSLQAGNRRKEDSIIHSTKVELLHKSAEYYKHWKQEDSLLISLEQLRMQAMAEQQLYYDAEWIHLQFLMHQKRSWSALLLLQNIAADRGAYSEQAQMILQQVSKNK